MSLPNFFPIAVLIAIATGLAFGADEKTPEPDVAKEAMPEWARGWSVLWVSFPPLEKADKPQVDLQRPDGTAVSLTVDGQTPDGVKLVEVAWVNSPMATAVVTLEKGGGRAAFSVASDFVSRRDVFQPKAPQLVIESRFIELSETTARRLKSPAGGGKARDHTGIDLLGARLGGEPAVNVLTAAQHQELLRSLAGLKGVDVLSTPCVTTRAKQRAIIEIIREFRYPTEFDPVPEVKGGWNPKTFETRNCGITLEAEPDVNDAGAITLRLVPQVVDFLGFRDIDTGRRYPANTALAKSLAERMAGPGAVGQRFPTHPGWRVLPVFSARKIETSVTLMPGDAVLLVGIREEENAERFPSRAATHRLAVLVSARTIESETPLSLSPAASAKTAPVQPPEIIGKDAGVP